MNLRHSTSKTDPLFLDKVPEMDPSWPPAYTVGPILEVLWCVLPKR